ncbi:MAG: alpha-L-glutamate ligase-like protein [Bdellovibrionota bacterium]
MLPSFARKLREAGIVGINQRNARYLLPANDRSLYPLVDDKLRTKKLAQDAGIAVPELYNVISTQHDVYNYDQALVGIDSFVIKPARGSGGEGIIVINSQRRERYQTIDGSYLTQDEIRYHTSRILSGIYSLGGRADAAIFEYRVCSHSIFDEVSYKGVPDIRVIVYFGVPVMAMVRLPTRSSYGKANLHQGAIGAGVDMLTGTTRAAVSKNQIVFEHPDTGHPVDGILIPHWEKLLLIAARAYELTGLGYQGVDIVIDQDKGPLILELNARPGLSIQLANQRGLRGRLDFVEKNIQKEFSAEQRVELSKQLASLNF